jgi:WD40 repeat protein
VAFNHDGSLLATGDKTGHIVIWDPKTGKQRATCATPVMYTWDKVARLHSIGGIRSLAFSPDSKQLAVGGMGKVGNIDHLEGKARIEILTWETGKQVVEFQSEKFKGLVNRLSWASDSTWLLGMGGAGEGFAEFIDPVSQKSLKAEKLPMHIHDIDVQGNHEKILAAGHNKIVAYTMS